jgi:mannitol/fructose-specific phosphotransferase system IIA component (Ntr-type)
VPAQLTVADAMSAHWINLDLRGTDRDAVLHELVALIIAPSEPHWRDVLFQALKAREDLCSTCVDEGVAIPHSRNAIVGVVEKPMLGYGRHQTGIEFGALDGQPVHHFFLLCAPNVRQHLLLLARLARLVKEPALRAALSAAETPNHALAIITAAEQNLRLPN